MVEECEKANIDIIIPPLWCTTDNASMIAKVALKLYKKGIFAPLSIGADPNWEIEDCLDVDKMLIE